MNRYLQVFFVAVAALLIFATVSRAQPKAPLGDVKVLSIKVQDVAQTYSISGQVSKRWTIKAFIHNNGKEVVREVPVGLSVWKGKSAKLPAEKRYLSRKAHSVFLSKKLGQIAPGTCKHVTFQVMTDETVKTIIAGIWADYHSVNDKLSVSVVKKGIAGGVIAEADKEADNYLEKRLSY